MRKYVRDCDLIIGKFYMRRNYKPIAILKYIGRKPDDDALIIFEEVIPQNFYTRGPNGYIYFYNKREGTHCFENYIHKIKYGRGIVYDQES